MIATVGQVTGSVLSSPILPPHRRLNWSQKALLPSRCGSGRANADDDLAAVRAVRAMIYELQRLARVAGLPQDQVSQGAARPIGPRSIVESPATTHATHIVVKPQRRSLAIRFTNTDRSTMPGVASVAGCLSMNVTSSNRRHRSASITVAAIIWLFTHRSSR